MEGVHETHKPSRIATEDVFSNMPDNVITNIMNRLRIRDAVRTSILARNWRLKWTLLTELVFDNWYSWSLVPLGVEGQNYIDSRIISRLLLLLKGPITKFVLDIPHDQTLDVGDLNHWVLFLSSKGIKEFAFMNSKIRSLKLPAHLFSCLELTHLKLQNCLFQPSLTFCGFPSLLSLSLCSVHFESGDFGDFISRCPLLEILEMSLSCGDHHISKVNLHDIAKLVNLKRVTLTLRLLENRAITTSSIFQFLGFLPKLEELNLDFLWCEFVEETIARKWVPMSFPCLTTLLIFRIDFGNASMLSRAFEMIWGFPNLKKLYISVPGPVAGYEFYGAASALPSSDLDSYTAGQLQLQTVNIEYFRGSDNEICLLKYLLACSPFLKRIDLLSSPPLPSDERLMAARKLLKLHRSSAVAEIDFY